MAKKLKVKRSTASQLRKWEIKDKGTKTSRMLNHDSKKKNLNDAAHDGGPAVAREDLSPSRGVDSTFAMTV